METYILAVALLAIITLAAIVALVLIYKVDHKYSEVLFNLTIIGCIHLAFYVFYVATTCLTKTENVIDTIHLGGDLYAFSIICFSTSVANVFVYITIDRSLVKIFYWIFLVISLCIICGMEKILRKCICLEDIPNKLKFNAPVLTIGNSDSEVKRVNKLAYCYDPIDPMLAGIFLEYALIYVPISVLFYITIRHTSFNEWFNKPCVVKCTGCQFNMSLCYHIAITFLIIIWCLRPIYLLSGKFTDVFYNVPSEHDDIIPMLSLLAIFFIILIYVIKVYGFGKNHLKAECLNNTENNYDLL